MTLAIPYPVQRMVRESMAFSAIVDINGVMNPKTGGFHVVQDAIDAGHQSIFVRAGTYPPFTLDVANAQVWGESWDVVIDGASIGDAVVITGARAIVGNMSAHTNAGSGNYWTPFRLTAAEAGLVRVQVTDSDAYGMRMDGAECYFYGCTVQDADLQGVWWSSVRGRMCGCYVKNTGSSVAVDIAADNFLVTGNHIAGGEIQLRAGANNGIVDGNILDTAIDNSGTGNTIGDNEVY